MATRQSSLLFSSSSSSSSAQRIIRASIIPAQKNSIQSSEFSVPSLKVNGLVDELKRQNSLRTMRTTSKMRTITMKEESTNSNVVEEMYAIMEAVADRVEMHKNIGEQRNNWNQLLLASVNGMITTAATMAGVAAMSGVEASGVLALKFSSTLLYVAATGILMIMNKIQPSQLAEEQRNASRLFKQLHEEFKTTLALKKVTSKDVEIAIKKVLALDRAYPLPLLGVMLDKFPKTVEPAMWWPKHEESQHLTSPSAAKVAKNGWSEMLEEEMRKLKGRIKKKDEEDYVKLAKMALKINKILAISGPLLTGFAAAGSTLMGSASLALLGTWPLFLAVVCGALAMVVNTIEHGGQVGMVFEMYRSSAGFFRFMEENIASALEEGEADRRENGEVFEARVALELGRSPSELRELANALSSSKNPEEFASKLY